MLASPISQDAELTVDPDALMTTQARASGTLTLDGTQFLSPEVVALWGKAYEPANPKVFPSVLYGGTPAAGIPQSTDPAVVRQELTNHFQNFVASGKLPAR